MNDPASPPTARDRVRTAFGWTAGGCAGLLANYGLFLVVGDGWPKGPTTFVLFVAGAFGGMALSDRLGDRAFRALGLAAGVLLAVVLAMAVLVLTSARPE